MAEKEQQMADLSTEQIEKVLVQETGAGLYQMQAIAGGTSFFVDEPMALGGLGSGPNPYDLLGTALAACTAMTLRLYAERKHWPLEHVSVRVGHVRGTLTARDRFEREVMVEGDLDDAQRAKLLEIANRCPVHITLERGADVVTQMRGPIVYENAASSHDMHVSHMMESSAEAASFGASPA